MSQTGYWVGPHGVLVPNSVEWVTDVDGVNEVDRHGSCTEMASLDPYPTPDEYRAQYAALDPATGNWYYKETD